MNPLESPRTFTRRGWIARVGAAALLAQGRWPGTLKAAEGPANPARFTFVAVNDTHHMSPECTQWLTEVVEMMKEVNPAFCLHLGDLSDTGKTKDLAAVRDVFGRLQVPFYPMIGNHDWVNQTDRSTYEAIFPNTLNYVVRTRGWQIVCLDSTEGKHFEQTRVGEATLAWVDRQLPTLDLKAPLILCTHFPMGETVKYRPLNADELLEKFIDHNLQAVMNGHFHGFTEHRFHAANVTTDRCCALRRMNHDGTKEKGFFVYDASEGKLSRRFVQVPCDGLPPIADAGPVRHVLAV